MNLKRLNAFWIFGLGLGAFALGQTPVSTGPANPPTAPPQTRPQPPVPPLSEAFGKAERDGVEVRVKDIARFRGIRGNQLVGYGLVMGLAGTGDTKKSVFTRNSIANMLKSMGLQVDPTLLDVKNVAAVMVTAELPPFATNGQRIDVTVTSIGDAKSLQGGTLIRCELYAAGDPETVYAVAQGALSIGGFQVSSNGSSVQKNHVTVGRVPGGAFVERGAPTRVVYSGQMFLELDTMDLTTAQRLAQRISDLYPEFNPFAEDGRTIALSLPEHLSPVEAMSRLEMVTVMADVPAVVVINERTGTIVIGGNVRVGPAAIAHGALNIRIQTDPFVSQPNSFSQGRTVVGEVSSVEAEASETKVALLPPATTVQDLARIFQALQLKPTDIIAILQALRQQGALKARLEIQ